MKNTVLLILFIALTTIVTGQTLRDFKTKSSANSTERTQMLDLMRDGVSDQVGQEVTFVVNHFKFMNNL